MRVWNGESKPPGLDKVVEGSVDVRRERRRRGGGVKEQEGGRPQRKRDRAQSSQVAGIHEAKSRRAEKRGPKEKSAKGIKLCGGDEDEDREMPVVNR